MKYKRLAATGFLVASTVVTCASLFASTAVIGMTSAQNGVTIDDSNVSGNATIFEGSNIATAGYSRIHLNNGTRVDLSAGSRARVFGNRTSLESGTTEIQSGSAYEIDARSLKIQPMQVNSIARVRVGVDKRIMVTAVNAPVAVRNSEGLLVARVYPSLPMAFLPQAGSSTSFDNTGCVLSKDGATILADASGNQIFEIRGRNFRNLLGNQVHITGTIVSGATPAGGAMQVVTVTSATQTAKGGCTEVAGKTGASTSASGAGGAGAGAAGAGAAAAAGGAIAGIAAGSSTALVVAGVGVAAAAGIGAGVAASNGSTPQSSTP